MNALPSWIVPLGVLGTLTSLGLLAGVLFERLGAPRVAAYLLVGLAFSKDALGRALPLTLGSWAEPITTVALGLIAYLIGGSLSIAQLRKLGRVVVLGALGESLFAVVLVTLITSLIYPHNTNAVIPPFALALGAIAATTAPAATVAVLHQYRARGPMSSILLGIVALDDAIGIIIFSLISALLTGHALSAALVPALVEILGSLSLGAIMGGICAELGKRTRKPELVLPLIVGLVALLVALAETLHLSPLLACMSLGFVTRTAMPASAERLFAPIELIEELVFIVFFGIAGMHFRAQIFVTYLPLITVYVLVRAIGKYLGAFLGTRIAHAPPRVSRWLGLGLVPQAGVAVGLALRLSHEPALARMAPILLNVVLGSTLIYELIGPLLARLALSRAGEIPHRHQEKTR